MATIFTKIIDGEIPGQIVWSDEVCVAFLDIEPLNPGHTLVVPRAEVDHWIDLDEATRAHLFEVAAQIGRAQLATFGGTRVGVIVQGFEVPHTHVHVFPSNDAADFLLDRKQLRSPEDLAADGDRLRAALRQAGAAGAIG